MVQSRQAPPRFLSPAIYRRILSSSSLRRDLFPEGLSKNPYEILSYDATLKLFDSRGARASFSRQQLIRFTQDGVSAILDHYWGDGVGLTTYDNSAGSLEGSLLDGRRRHLVIGLKHSTVRGTVLPFTVTRQAIATFTQPNEWLETIVDHPIQRIRQEVFFPVDRPCLKARLFFGKHSMLVPVSKTASGQTVLRYRVERPVTDAPYLLRWVW